MAGGGTKKILIRADGSERMGLGHLKRSDALARALARAGADVLFVTEEHAAARAVLDGAAYNAQFVPPATSRSNWIQRMLRAAGDSRPDVVFLDVRDTEPELTRGLKAAAPRVVSMDDFGEGPAEEDALIIVGHNVVDALVPATVRRALGDRLHQGLSYAIIGENLLPHRATALKNMSERRALVMFGGSDPHGVTVKAASALAGSPRIKRLDVIFGPQYAGEESDAAIRRNIIVHRDPRDLPELMARSTLAVCGIGQSAFELAMMGTPCVIVSQSPIHETYAEHYAELRSAVHVARQDLMKPDNLRCEVERLLEDRVLWDQLRGAAIASVDGQGAGRVAEILLSLARG